IRVMDTSKGENIGQISAGNRDRFGAGAGGDQQFVEGDLLAAVERDGSPRRIEVRGAPAGCEFDVPVGKPLRRLSNDLGAAALAGQIGGVQARAVVGAIDLLPDK